VRACCVYLQIAEVALPALPNSSIRHAVTLSPEFVEGAKGEQVEESIGNPADVLGFLNLQFFNIINTLSGVTQC
jgi:hypothetical protein